MYKKILASGFISLTVLTSNLLSAYAVDVWASSYMSSGEWGRICINDYVVTESIRGDRDRFTVNVKHVGDASKNQVSVQEYEFRRKDGLWCAYVKTSPTREAYVPIGTHINNNVVAIFDVCRRSSSFIIFSESDRNARKAKSYFDEGTKCYFDLNDYPRSVDCFTNAIKLYPQYYEAYIRRARAYDCMGDYSRAIADYRYVIDSGNDEYNIARNEIGDVMKKIQN